MKFTIFLFFIFTSSQFALSQESKPENATKYQEIIQKIARKDISFIDKYNTPYKHLEITEQINIDKQLIRYAKMESDKHYLIDLYCDMYTLTNALNKKTNDNKIYLDSALLYVNNTNDKISLGKLYYTVGNYYWDQKDEELSHQFLRKSIAICEKEKGAELVVLNSLYRIAVSYLWRQDAVSMKQCIDRMVQIANSIKSPEANIITYPVISAYYRIVANNPEISDETYFSYLDSIYKYDNKTIHIYESGDKTLKENYANKMSTYYNNLVEVISIKENPDWDEVVKLLDKGSHFLQNSDTLAIHRNYHTKSRALYNQKKYDESITLSLKALNLLQKYTQEAIACFYDTYSILVDNYKAKNNYKSALTYEQQRSDIIKKMNKIERYEAIKDLEAKYQTAEKELEISRLNEEKQNTKYWATLIVSFSIILIILFLIGFLYNRIKRIKKEKEALLLAAKVEQKEKEYKLLLTETEQKILRKYLEGKESERKSLAKELHDSVANDIVSIILLYKGGNEKEKVELMLKNTYDHIRQISHQLMPPEFKYISLIGLIEDYVEILNNTTSTSYKINIVDASVAIILDEITESQMKEIYYIIQESLGNIRKHTNAKNAEIRLLRNEEKIIFQIIDDGKGFDTQQVRKGIGLQTIKDRCLGLNAELEIGSVAGKGTTITISLSYLANPVLNHQY